MLNERSPGARVTSLTKELHRREYRTAMQWGDKYQSNWQALNPFQSPERLSPRLSKMSKEDQPQQSTQTMYGPSRYTQTNSNLPTLPGSKNGGGRGALSASSPHPPNTTTHLSQRLQQLRLANSNSSPTASLSSTANSPVSFNSTHSSGMTRATSPNRTDRRTFHHLRHSDNREAFYAKFVAKPKYNSIPSL